MALTRFDKAGFARIREPWEARDYKRVGQLAHALKGTCSYIAAKQAQRAALRLEQGAKALANSAPSSAEGSDNSYLAQEVTAALHDLQVELQEVMPAVTRALADLAVLS